MKLDRSYLTRIFTSLCNCKSPGEMKDLFVPQADRLDLEDLKNRAEAFARSGDHQKAARLCCSGTILALEANDDNYDVLVLAVYWYSFSAGPDVLAEAIARTVPILMYQHDQGQALNLGFHVAKVTQFCKDAEQNKNRDLLSIGYLALGALLIFRPMTQSTERIEGARELEQSLGLSGMEDWVKRNYK